MAKFRERSGRREATGNVAEIGPFLIAIRAQNGASSENARLSSILPKFRGVLTDSLVPKLTLHR